MMHSFLKIFVVTTKENERCLLGITKIKLKCLILFRSQ
jgi:hypothetical protein